MTPHSVTSDPAIPLDIIKEGGEGQFNQALLEIAEKLVEAAQA